MSWLGAHRACELVNRSTGVLGAARRQATAGQPIFPLVLRTFGTSQLACLIPLDAGSVFAHHPKADCHLRWDWCYAALLNKFAIEGEIGEKDR